VRPLTQRSTVLSRPEHCWTVISPQQGGPICQIETHRPVQTSTLEDEREGQSEARCTKGYLAQSEEMIVSSAFAQAN